MIDYQTGAADKVDKKGWKKMLFFLTEESFYATEQGQEKKMEISLSKVLALEATEITSKRKPDTGLLLKYANQDSNVYLSFKNKVLVH